MNRNAAAALITTLLLAHAVGTADAQEAPSDPPLPPPGRMVDLGGWRVQLHCTGPRSDSAPTVVLEAGAGGFSVDWSLVQPEIVRFARVCAYDQRRGPRLPLQAGASVRPDVFYNFSSALYPSSSTKRASSCW